MYVVGVIKETRKILRVAAIYMTLIDPIKAMWNEEVANIHTYT